MGDLSPTSKLWFISNYSKCNPCWFKSLRPHSKLRNKWVVNTLHETTSARIPVSIVHKGIRPVVISQFCSMELRHSVSSCEHTQSTPTLWHSAMLLRKNDGTPDLRETNAWRREELTMVCNRCRFVLSCREFCWISLGCANCLLGESNLFSLCRVFQEE